MVNFTIGVIGNGFVGRATSLFRCRDVDVLNFDTNPKLCSEGVSCLSDLLQADIVFICLPTPMEKNGSCHTKIVEKAIKDLRAGNYKGSIVVRSTVPVGFCDKNCVSFMPEFLTESNWENDFRTTRTWTIAGNNIDTNRLKTLISLAFDNSVIETNLIDCLTNKEAELVKYTRNCFLALKVSFFNEIYQFCQAVGIDYNRLVSSVVKDERVGKHHTKVPGPDGSTGWALSCLPKDTSSLSFQMKSVNCQPIMIDAAILRNNQIDRISADWKNLKGRAVV